MRDNINLLRQRRNFLLNAMPKALALAKKTEVAKVRHGALELYFNQWRRLREVEEEIEKAEAARRLIKRFQGNLFTSNP